MNCKTIWVYGMYNIITIALLQAVKIYLSKTKSIDKNGEIVFFYYIFKILN